MLSGFQSPAADYLEGRLNITDLLVIDPHCTYYFQMDCQATKNQGLRSGDLLIIDKYQVTLSAGKKGRVIQEIHYNNNFIMAFSIRI